MTGKSSHSAAGQALGYVHQCMWALIELGKRAPLEPAAQLRLEVLDDIEFDSAGSPTELLQMKHHTRSAGTLTAQSADLWRTLNVWMDLNTSDPLVLRLVTTQMLSEDSGLIHLRDGNSRDTSVALEELLDAARTSTNRTTDNWRKKFLDLDEIHRLELINRIVIDDGSLLAGDIDKELVRIFRYGCPNGQEKVFLHHLKGWWAGVSVKLLTREREMVTGQELLAQVEDLTDQFTRDTLPIDPVIMEEYDESNSNLYKDWTFVQQLLWITLENNRLQKAIRDYHRSFTQRSVWFRNQLLAETELDRFAFRLHDEWEQIFDSRVADMKRKGRTDYDVIGQEILEEVSRSSRACLRYRFDEPWFNRGMFHALANGDLGKKWIGWHPEFELKLEEILGHASST
ncbi:ABC-three component system protein [Rothia sp. CCM 9419]|uniref:ABC-three component system protein n=1 Tax=Rothia sp. CCM 9419 TaxID=3402662 RepID=UPI003AE2E1A8